MEYDYELQVWVLNGIVQKCSHPPSMNVLVTRNCCNAYRFAGMPLKKAKEFKIFAEY